jgi:hypothetical protein
MARTGAKRRADAAEREGFLYDFEGAAFDRAGCGRLGVSGRSGGSEPS